MASRTRKQATRGSNRPAMPAWAWLGIGVVLGLLVALFFLQGDWAPMLRKQGGPQPNPEAVAPRESDPPLVETREKPRKNYDFYSALPMTTGLGVWARPDIHSRRNSRGE